MAKFSQTKMKSPVKAGAIKTKNKKTLTHEGGEAWKFDKKSELFLLAVTNMVGEGSFYESTKERDSRFISLIHTVAKKDPEWIRNFIPYLRNVANMRSASVVIAAEYVAAKGPNGREVIASALSRADEPAEMLAYWSQRYGKNFPAPVKRGVADAVNKLYNQRSAIKYDGIGRLWRMGDVIELTHPKPQDEEHTLLFKYLLDRRHHPDDVQVPDSLRIISSMETLEKSPAEERRGYLDHPEILKEAGFTWEKLSGWLNGPMDAKAWESIIPAMGYMALLRNLRNFDDAKISKRYVDIVTDKLIDPEQVKNSKQFPYRFYSAYKNTNTTRWVHALETALELSVDNVPKFDKKTLVLTDVSGSMFWGASNKSNIQLWEIGAVFAAAVAKNTEDVDLVAFATSSQNTKMPKGASVLRTVEKIENLSQNLGGGTNIWPALTAHMKGHEKVVIFTDMQAFPVNGKIPEVNELFTFDLAGYGKSYAPTGKKGYYTFGGFSDAAFSMMKILEEFDDGRWPF